MRRRVRVASPVILDLAMREVFIDLARMNAATLSHEIQQQLSPLSPRSWPGQSVLGWHAAIGPRVHQRLKFPGDESVIDEEILLDPELHIPAFQIACFVVLDAMTKDEVLGPGRRSNRVGLDKLQPMQGAFQSGRRKQTLRHKKPPQMVERNRHQEILPNPTYWEAPDKRPLREW